MMLVRGHFFILLTCTTNQIEWGYRTSAWSTNANEDVKIGGCDYAITYLVERE